jgi:hypothetical protein
MRTLCRGYTVVTTFTNTGTYHGAVLAPKFIKACRVGPTLISRITSLVCMFKDVEVVVINVIAYKDIGDEFQDRGLSNASLSNKKDGVWWSCCLL